MLYLAQDGGADPHDFAAAHGFLDRCRSRPASSCVWRFQTDLNGRSQGCNLLPCLLAMEPYGTGRRSWIFLCRVKAGLAAAAPARYLVCKVRLELTRPCGHQVLNLARLPFRHMRIWWAGLDLNQQCFLCHDFTGRLLQPVCIPTHIGCRGGIRTRILRCMRPLSYQLTTLQYCAPKSGLVLKKRFEPLPCGLSIRCSAS